MEQTKICLYGASGHSKVILDILKSNGQDIAFYIDDNKLLLTFNGYEVRHEYYDNTCNFINIIVSIGNNRIRKKIVSKLIANHINAIHQSSQIGKGVDLGVGNVIMSNVSINADSRIGNHCIINTNASVDHDCTIDNFVHLSPNVALAGDVKIGEGTHIGIGACVIQGIKIGKWATIGAGSVIINDIPDYAVVVGNPGRIIKYNEV